MSTLREVLTEIRDRTGELTTQAVVDTARPKSHPLHSRFEWNDKVAGEAYRRQQAGELIRSVRIRYVDEPEPKEVNVFHVVRRETGRQSYEPVEEVAADPVAREIVLREMRREWQAFERRYRHLEEFYELIGSRGN
jgi:N6-adenosine-specific RNA methylase IME4